MKQNSQSSAAPEKTEHQASGSVFAGFSSAWKKRVQQIGLIDYLVLLVVVACTAATILTTWPVWQHRDDPANLPLFLVVFELPPISFGGLLLGILFLVVLVPREAVLAFVTLLAVSMAFDQIRFQPQMFAMPLMMTACVFRSMRPTGYWYLVSMWLWAAIHKSLSPYWLGPVSWTLLARMNLDSVEHLYLPFAIVVIVTEAAVALLAIIRPRWAVPLCIALHLGIIGMLTGIRWNYSVVPWNLATMVAGSWWLWAGPNRWQAKTDNDANRVDTTNIANQSDDGNVTSGRRRWRLARTGLVPAAVWHRMAIGFLLLSPSLVYIGWMPHFLCHVLYSDNMPVAAISAVNIDQAEKITTWQDLNVPIPRTHRVLVDYFRAHGKPGSRLHIQDPRPGMPDQFFQVEGNSKVNPISPDEFFANGTGVPGTAVDDASVVFQLQRGGIRLVARKKNAAIYAIQFTPENYRGELLNLASRLANLQQIQLQGCPVADHELACLTKLNRLSGIGLEDTPVTDACLEHLARIPSLSRIDHNNTRLSAQAVRNALGQ